MVTDQKLKVNPSARLQELNLAALAPTNAAEFRHPLTLLRLAHFVRDATKVRAAGQLMLARGLAGSSERGEGSARRGLGGRGGGGYMVFHDAPALCAVRRRAIRGAAAGC